MSSLSLSLARRPQSGGDKMLGHISMNVNLIGLSCPDVRDKQDEMPINLKWMWTLYSTFAEQLQ